jgi:hypothetical protein
MSKLQALHDLLHDETKWPEGFKWDYSLRSHCALGLATKSGLLSLSDGDGPYAFDLTQHDWLAIFQRPARGDAFHTSEANWQKVTPVMVARRIKKHLKARAT